MTVINGYITLYDLKDSLKANTSVSDADYELAISSASRWIDGYCSDPKNGRIRYFYRDAAPSARRYRAETLHLVCVGDFDDPSTTVVEVDQVGNGTWVPLGASLWQAEPLVRLNGHPFTQVTATEYASTFPLGLKPRVRVTARWGWVSIPDPVKQACQILSVAYLLGKDAISNVDEYSVGSRGPADPMLLAEHLLEPFLPDSVRERIEAAEAAQSVRRR